MRLLGTIGILGIGLAVLASAETKPTPRTFTKDVAPILQARCQTCHRPGEAAPMSLLTYQEARPWAKAIKEAVLLKRMPPWFADSSVGHFKNDRSLSQSEIGTLVSWVDTGAQEGDAKDLPAALNFVTGWNIGEPDLVLEMPQAFDVPAGGTVDYQYVILPQKFPEDRWVQAAEVRPGARSAVHHVIAFIREPGSKWMRDKTPGIPFVPDANEKGDRPSITGDMLAGYAPGVPAVQLAPGQGRLVKAGSDIVFQLHYTANGKPAQDRSKVGVVFCKTPPATRVMTLAASNSRFTIPPGDPNYKVESQLELAHDVTLRALAPHMHLRGKDFEYRLIFPTGEQQTILRVPRYDFNWQLWYTPEEDMLLPKGTKVACTAHFDNSLNNPANPDPSKAVKFGEQSWEEMMIGFFDVAFDAKLDPKLLLPEKKSPRSGD
uniref:Thiol-disulfide isomerase n=1 Tax=Solibacter usitatus (strain Ellin6076) TaxID=234267 RepID=Q020C4_SOLUE